jgi:predicted ATPase
MTEDDQDTNDEDAAGPTRRLKRLTIDDLFGPGTPQINILLKLDQRVTVLHGRNGSGKTITLELLAAICRGYFELLDRYPFTRLEIETTDGATLTLTRSLVVTLRNGAFVVTSHLYELAVPEQPTESNTLPQLSPDQLAQLSRTHQYDRSLQSLWVHKREDIELDTPAFIQRIRETHGDDAIPPLVHEDSQLAAFLRSLAPIRFIKADRLYTRVPRSGPELTIEHLGLQIRQLIVAADRQYRATSSHLDSSLPKRLFAAHQDLPTLEQLRERSKNLREQTEHLIKIGLLREQIEPIDEAALTEDQKKTFFVILKDREEKLAPFMPVASKAHRLLDSLNRKLAPKVIRLDVERGYQVLSAAGEPLPLRYLSSGEQHELVLLHELLFDVQPGSLILIDEPELSLHVTWQADVLPDLLAIAELAQLDIVLATHSPYIVGDHTDLMVRLGEPV